MIPGWPNIRVQQPFDSAAHTVTRQVMWRLKMWRFWGQPSAKLWAWSCFGLDRTPKQLVTRAAWQKGVLKPNDAYFLDSVTPKTFKPLTSDANNIDLFIARWCSVKRPWHTYFNLTDTIYPSISANQALLLMAAVLPDNKDPAEQPHRGDSSRIARVHILIWLSFCGIQRPGALSPQNPKCGVFDRRTEMELGL